MSWFRLRRRRPPLVEPPVVEPPVLEAAAAEPVTVDDGPPQVWRDALAEAVAHLPGSDEVARHVLTGQEPAAVAFLAGARIGISTWSPTPRGKVSAETLRTLYRGFADVDAVVLRRWVEVLDAVQPDTYRRNIPVAPVPGAGWVGVTLAHLVAAAPADGPLPASFDDLARVAALDGVSASHLLTTITMLPPAGPGRDLSYTPADLSRLPGLGAALRARPDVLTAGMTQGAPETRCGFLEVVDRVLDDDTLGSTAHALAVAATCSSMRVRERAEQILARVPGAEVPLRSLAVDGDPAVRGRALTLLAQRPDQLEWARATASADRAASVRGLVERWAPARPAVDDDVALDPLTPVQWSVPPDVARSVTQDLEDASTAFLAHERAHPWGRATTTPAPLPGWRRTLEEFLTDTAPPSTVPRVELPVRVVRDALVDVAHRADVGTGGTMKLALALTPDPWQSGLDRVLRSLVTRYRVHGSPDLRTIAAMLDDAGVDGFRTVWRSYAGRRGARLGRRWDDADVWPFVAEHLDRILADRSSGLHGDETALLQALATLPRRPARVVDHLVGLALGSRTTLQGPARALLAGTAGIAERAAAGLLERDPVTRVAAARWLAELADPSTLRALQDAWASERNDLVRGALLDALVALGEDAGTYLDPRTAERSAARAVARGLPAVLDWCAWDELPEVRWAATGETVPRVVVQWWCSTAVRSRTPVPDAVLRHHAALLDPEGRRRLALALLTGWLQADLAPLPRAAAEAEAHAQAVRGRPWLTATGGRYPGMSLEELTAALAQDLATRPAGSAVDSKGVLAVVAACGGGDVVPPSERYLREWWGRRASQGKALITMLAWVDDPAATQLVLSVGARFRTKGLQDAAAAEAAALAERKGWTVDELADRTVPTAGFDADGVLALSYGPRTFVARLLPDLEVELRDAEGARIRALPARRATDDAAQVSAARRTLAAARKDVRTITDQQRRRWYEAMCTERSWPADHWQQHLLAHPVVGLAARRLVWVATDADTAPVAFRPLEDGTLTDVEDRPVVLAPTARVRLAHDTLLTPDEVAAWQAHLADYDITPLLEQLGRGVHTVTEQDAARTVLRDFEGHLVAASALRARAARLGYRRGHAENGGWVTAYTKHFPALEVTAVVGHTGNDVPETDRTVALQTLSFLREAPGEQVAPLMLGEVPAVLVSECWHDLRQMAAAGSGFDPGWRETVTV